MVLAAIFGFVIVIGNSNEEGIDFASFLTPITAKLSSKFPVAPSFATASAFEGTSNVDMIGG